MALSEYLLTSNNNPRIPCLLQHLLICSHVFLRGDSLLNEAEVDSVAVEATLKGKNRTSGTPIAEFFLIPFFFDSSVSEVEKMSRLHVAAHDTKEGREGSVRNIPGPVRSTGNTAKPNSGIDCLQSGMCNDDEIDSYKWFLEAVASDWCRPTAPFGKIIAAMATAEEQSGNFTTIMKSHIMQNFLMREASKYTSQEK